MQENRTFFKNVQRNKMTLGDIFSDVFKKHTAEQTAQVFTAGTVLTTPTEDMMLAQWNKPFLFFRFFLFGILLSALAFFTAMMNGGALTFAILLAVIPIVVPVTLLLLAWEMNIPRNISLLNVLLFFALGGLLSLTFTMALFEIQAHTIGALDEGVEVLGVYLNSAVFAAITEEPAKLLAVYLILKWKNYRHTLNGVLVGAAVGAGFAVFESMGYVLFYGMMEGGLAEAINMGLLRAFSAIPGHGGYAALYGGGLVLAMHGEKLRAICLLRWDFLKYFLASMLLHGFHNWYLPSEYLPPVVIPLSEELGLELLLYPTVLLSLVVWLLLFLPLVRRGVNEIVSLAIRHSGGSVTQAVYAVRKEPAAVPPKGCVLLGLTGPFQGTAFPIGKGEAVNLGRDTQWANIVLHGYRSVSSRHCRVSESGGVLYATDMGSTNGTYVNGQRLSPGKPVELRPGDTLRLAAEDCEFRFDLQ